MASSSSSKLHMSLQRQCIIPLHHVLLPPSLCMQLRGFRHSAMEKVVGGNKEDRICTVSLYLNWLSLYAAARVVAIVEKAVEAYS